jgi:hypothetical protein
MSIENGVCYLLTGVQDQRWFARKDTIQISQRMKSHLF